MRREREGMARIGIVGTGNIIGQYFDTFDRLPDVEVVALAAGHLDNARAVAEPRGLRALPTADLIADPEIDLVVNLTPPRVHAEVNQAVVTAGKHLYSEKPLVLEVADGHRLLAAADRAGVAVGCAPDTFLGTGIQSAAKALDDGLIGDAVGALALWGAAGPEPWHPAPQSFYSTGGGPVLDMGPYYVTTLVALLGPVASVTARSVTSRRRRVVGSGPLAGTPVRVEVPTYATAILEHVGGALSTVVLSFDTFGEFRELEIHGSAGRLRLPDPNWFSGRGSILAAGAADWRELEPIAGYRDTGRGIGAAELLRARAAGHQPRASGALALHVTEVLRAINDAASGDGPVVVSTRPDRPSLVELAPDTALGPVAAGPGRG